MSDPLYGDKALELFFGSNASGVATAMWATAMRNNYEDRMAQLRQTIATQAARIAELEKQVAWKEGLIRQLTDVDMPAMEAQLAQVQADKERLRAELASTTQWVPAPDGQIPESNLWIVSAHGDGWFLEFGKNGAKVWFPGVVRIYVDSEQIKTEGGA